MCPCYVHANIFEWVDFSAWILSWTLHGYFNPGWTLWICAKVSTHKSVLVKGARIEMTTIRKRAWKSENDNAQKVYFTQTSFGHWRAERRILLKRFFWVWLCLELLMYHGDLPKSAKLYNGGQINPAALKTPGADCASPAYRIWLFPRRMRSSRRWKRRELGWWSTTATARPPNAKARKWDATTKDETLSSPLESNTNFRQTSFILPSIFTTN